MKFKNTKNNQTTSEELKRILKNHTKWLQSKGKEGEQADLSNTNPFVRIHHHHNYRDEILNSEICGCFYCLEIFSPNEIDQWHMEDESGIEQVAICPMCGIDSVLGDSSGLPVETNFLSIMHEYFFSPHRGFK